MVETIAFERFCNTKSLRQMYLKVVKEPNRCCPRKGFIKCPECGEWILMIPTLSKMNEAIENHVEIHKEPPNDNHFFKSNSVFHIRLSLAQQVLQEAFSSL